MILKQKQYMYYLNRGQIENNFQSVPHVENLFDAIYLFYVPF